MSLTKIDKYKKICNGKSNIKCIFIFNHIDTDNNNENEYYYYEIKFNELDDICFRMDTTFQLGIKHIKPLNSFIEILKK